MARVITTRCKRSDMARASFVPSGVKIKVIGLGGGGSNAVTRMAREGLRGIELIAMNTDGQALTTAEASISAVPACKSLKRAIICSVRDAISMHCSFQSKGIVGC